MTQEQFQQAMMEKFPVGSFVKVVDPHGKDEVEAEVLFHTANMRGQVDGLRVKLADRSIDDIHYDDAERYNHEKAAASDAS